MNTSEQALHDYLVQRGFLVFRNGWPDFLVLTEDRQHGMAIELKCGHDKVRPEQNAMHQALADFGIETFIARDPDLAALSRKGATLATFPSTAEYLKSLVTMYKSQADGLAVNYRKLEKALDDVTFLFDDPARHGKMGFNRAWTSRGGIEQRLAR